MPAVRNAVAGDLPAIAEVHRASVLAVAAAAYRAEQVDAWVSRIAPERYREAEEEGHRFLIAEADGRVAGFGSWRRAEISSLYVHPDFLRAGLGTALLHALEAAARASGAKELFVVASTNAVSFYERHGYVAERPVHDPIGRTGLTLEGVQLAKAA